MTPEPVTINGTVYTIAPRYEEGHELTAGEASALNQTMFENVRNNLSKRAKDGTLDQAGVDTYAQTYMFGVRQGGGGGATRDPVMSEAMSIAKGIIRKALQRKGVKLNTVDASAVTEAAKALLARDDSILELAKKRVAEAQAVAQSDLSDLVASIPAKAAATPAQG